MTTPNPTAPATSDRLEAAQADAMSRYRAAAEQLAAATGAVVAALTAMLAAGIEVDYVARRQGIDGAPEMRLADHLVTELRLCFDLSAATTTSPRDAVVGLARAAADARIAELMTPA